MVKMYLKHAIDFIFRLPKLYKIPKAFLEFEKFRAKTRRGICQEIYASFFIVSLSRLFDSIGKKKLSQTKLKSTVRA